MKVCVVIPIYNIQLEHNEKISLNQCLNVLKAYDKYVLLPEDLQMDFGKEITCIHVKKEYFSSRKRYSDYVLTAEFYDMFAQYDYMLIYQLDAFVFEDKLLEFCNLQYDYIGAPWLYGLECHVLEHPFLYVGNGGFSLRKISSFRNWIKTQESNVEYEKMLFLEDQVIASYGSRYLKIAPIDVALKFAFDLNPKDCYERNNKKLPFGCHAWYKFSAQFWRDKIERFGYQAEWKTYQPTEKINWEDGKKRAELFERYFDKTQIHNCLHELIQNYTGTVSVFGAGNCGFHFMNMIKGTQVRIDTLLDNSKEKIGKNIEGFKVKSLKDWQQERKNVILIAAFEPDFVIRQLEEIGLQRGIDFTTARDLQYKMIQIKEETERLIHAI